MSRSTIMTTGFLFILLGIQLNFVETYTLTPRATKFWAERLADPVDLTPLQTTANGNFNSPFSQASSGNGAFGTNRQQAAARPMFLRAKQITTPDWICWPIMFVGAVFCLQGILLKRD